MQQILTNRLQTCSPRRRRHRLDLPRHREISSSLESKRQELESYLAQLNSQYEELTDSVSQLSIQAAQKEDELQNMKLELAKAQQQSQQQYEAMKKRIVYMYENGGTTKMPELLLSSSDLTQFMNRAENISQLSKYDRDMLKKYEDLQASIQEQEENLEKEAASVNQLLAESASKKQEVQALVSSTNDSIASYISQISASQARGSSSLLAHRFPVLRTVFIV